jgi:hypothetical protein
MGREVDARFSQRQQAETIDRDFYGTYPQLNQPALRQVVATVARDVIASRGNDGSWNPALRDAIAQRVFGLLQATQGGQPGAPAAFAPPAAPAPAPQPGVALAPPYQPPPGYQLVPIQPQVPPQVPAPILGSAARPGGNGGAPSSTVNEVHDLLFGAL